MKVDWRYSEIENGQWPTIILSSELCVVCVCVCVCLCVCMCVLCVFVCVRVRACVIHL